MADKKVEKKAYTVNSTKKVITIDDTVKQTKRDEDDIKLYISVGYTIRHKSKERVRIATERATKENLTDAKILEALKGDEDKLKEYKKIKAEGGFFKAKSWYNKNCKAAVK